MKCPWIDFRILLLIIFFNLSVAHITLGIAYFDISENFFSLYIIFFGFIFFLLAVQLLLSCFEYERQFCGFDIQKSLVVIFLITYGLSIVTATIWGGRYLNYFLFYNLVLYTIYVIGQIFTNIILICIISFVLFVLFIIIYSLGLIFIAFYTTIEQCICKEEETPKITFEL